MKKVLFFVFFVLLNNVSYAQVQAPDTEDSTFQQLVNAVNLYDDDAIKNLLNSLDDLTISKFLIKNVGDDDKNTLLHLALIHAMNSDDYMQRDARLKPLNLLLNKIIELRDNATKILTTCNRYNRTVLHEAFFQAMESKISLEQQIRMSVLDDVLDKVFSIKRALSDILTFRPELTVKDAEMESKIYKDSVLHFVFKKVTVCDDKYRAFRMDVLQNLIGRINVRNLVPRAEVVFKQTDSIRFNLLHRAVELASSLNGQDMQRKYADGVFSTLLDKIGDMTYSQVKNIFNSNNEDGYPVFHYAFDQCIDLRFITLMLDCVKKLPPNICSDIVNSTDSFDSTPIFIAIGKAFDDQDELVWFKKLLDSDLSNWIDFLAQNKDNQTPLGFAANQAILEAEDRENAEEVLKVITKTIKNKLDRMNSSLKLAGDESISTIKSNMKSLIDMVASCKDEIKSAEQIGRDRIKNEEETTKLDALEGFVKRLNAVIDNALADFGKFNISVQAPEVL